VTPHTDPVPISTPDQDPSAVASATFSVAAEAVWQFRLDFSNLPDYNPDVTNLSRTQEGQSVRAGGTNGPGARYSFTMADPNHPEGGQPVELWVVDAIHPTLVAAGMKGGTEAYEEFVVLPQGEHACEATLMLWIILPDGLSEDVLAAASASGLAQIEKEMRLMKEALERQSGQS
jgi:hypothetical protein